MNRSNSAPATPSLLDEEENADRSRKRKLNFVLGQLRKNGRRRSSSEPSVTEKRLSSTVLHDCKENTMLFGGSEINISPIQPSIPAIKVFTDTPEHFPDCVRETRASRNRKLQLTQGKVFEKTPEHFPDFSRKTRASSSIGKPFAERVKTVESGLSSDGDHAEQPQTSEKSKPKRGRGKENVNNNKRRNSKPKPSMKRKREVRVALKKARENLKVTDVLDYTPLKGIKRATNLDFLDGLSPISFDTPKNKKKKLQIRDKNKITPTNRIDADRYLVELGKRAREAQKCVVPSCSTQPSDAPATSEIVMNLSKILEKSRDHTDDEEEVDDYFD